MKKQFKKIVAMSMVFVTSMGIIQPAFASTKLEGRTYEFMQEEEIFLASSKDYEVKAMSFNATDDSEIVTTYVETDDESYEIFTYEDGNLIEIVECSTNQDYILVKDVIDDEVINEEIIYVDVEEEDVVQIAPMAYKSVGIMDYYNSAMGTTLSVTVTRDDHTVDKTVSIKNGLYSIAQIAAFFVSAWYLPLEGAKDIALLLFGNFLINGVVEVIGTKKVTGTVTEYTWKGVPSDKSKGSTGYLDGLKVVYKDNNNKTKTHTGGYQPSAWKTDTFGRMMFYEVYRLEVYPTKWR